MVETASTTIVFLTLLGSMSLLCGLWTVAVVALYPRIDQCPKWLRNSVLASSVAMIGLAAMSVVVGVIAIARVAT